MKKMLLILASILLISIDGASQGYGTDNEFYTAYNYSPFTVAEPPQIVEKVISGALNLASSFLPPVTRDIIALTLCSLVTGLGIAICYYALTDEDELAMLGLFLGLPFAVSGAIGMVLSGISLGVDIKQKNSTKKTEVKFGFINYQFTDNYNYLARYPTPGISLIIHF